jgi:DNA-binding transcriptional LysR family regulator
MSEKIKRGDQINWNQVFYFSEIAAAGSIKDAAEKLGLTSSTLSAHLSQLESDLNIKLFQREHRKLTLTSDGASLFQSARQMFESGKRFIDVISPRSLGCYPVSIGIVPGASYAFAHNIIKKYIFVHGGTSLNVLRIQHDEIEPSLLQSKIDFGFTERKSDNPEIRQKSVVASDLSFFVSSHLPQKSLRQHLQKMPMVICRSERRVPSAVEEVLECLDLSPRNIIISEYPSLVEFLCRQGTAVGVLGALHFADEPGVRKLSLPKDFPSLKERLYATWAAGTENLQAIQSLIGILEETD